MRTLTDTQDGERDERDDVPDSQDDLYDRFLDACLAGEDVDPAAFCARHGVASAELIARLEGLHGMVAGRSRAGAAVEPQPGLAISRLGDFRILRLLDEGGMGTVYLAVQESLGRKVAVKVLRPELADSPTAVERFRREALALARMRHPHIVSVLAAGEEAGVRYLAMDLVPGRSLAELASESVARGETLPGHPSGLSSRRPTRWTSAPESCFWT